MTFAAEWGTGQVFLSMVYFFFMVIWFWLLITVLSDLFRSRDLSGGAKALWAILIVVLPYIGVFAYLFSRGSKMGEHAVELAQQQDQATLASMRARGILDEAEYQRITAKAAV